MSCQLCSQHLHILQLLLLWIGISFTRTLLPRPSFPKCLARRTTVSYKPHCASPHLPHRHIASLASSPKACCRKKPLPTAAMEGTLQELNSMTTCCLKPATKGKGLSDTTIVGLSWKQAILFFIIIHESCDFYWNSKNLGWQRWDIRTKEYRLRAKTQTLASNNKLIL